MTRVRDVLRLGVAVGAGTVLACSGAMAAESTLGSHLGLRLAHSDNIALAGAGAETSENVAVVTTGIDFARQQPRATSSVAYQVEGVFYDQAGDADEVYHYLDASTLLELAPDRLFVDLFGVYDQTIRDPADKYSFNNLALTGNRIDIGVIGVSPRVALAIGDNVAGEIRFGFTRANYDDPELVDSTERVVHFGLSNVGSRQGGTWGVDYNRQYLNYEPTTQFQFETFQVDLGYWVNSSVRIFAKQGLEGDYRTFEYTSVTTDVSLKAGLDEYYWYVGMEWLPDERTTLEVMAGERTFGKSHSLSWTRRLRFGGIAASYSEEPSSYMHQQMSSVRRTGELEPIDVLDGPLGPLAYLMERADVSFFYDRPRGDIGLRFFAENRFDLVEASIPGEDEPAEEYEGTELTFGWEVNSRSSLNATWQIANRHSDLNAVDDKLEYYTLGWVRSLGKQSELSVGASRQISTPRTAGASPNYEENQVTIGFRRSFGVAAAPDVGRRFSGNSDAAGTP